jgi:asparagine synthase (glutamine-hydrolysing)
LDGDLYTFSRLLNGENHKPKWLNIDLMKEQGVFIGFTKKSPQSYIKGRRLAAELAHSVYKRGLPGLLRHGDRNSMRWSVESRVPFLTADLANFLLSLPEHYLISHQGETKSIFRAAMRGIVPDAILDRKDKIGFETPEKVWLIGMADQIRAWLKEDISLPFLNQNKILEEFELIVARKKPFNLQVWRWINFIRWYKLSLDLN